MSGDLAERVLPLNCFDRFGMANGPAARTIGLVLITFFCTRCGTHLETEAENAGGRVRCEHCAVVTRVPDRADDGIPFARVATVAGPVFAPADAAADSPPLEIPTLSYVPAWPERQQQGILLDLIAERLKHVHADDELEGGDGDMAECRYCGSTIASFVKTCPFCRHPLWGI